MRDRRRRRQLFVELAARVLSYRQASDAWADEPDEAKRATLAGFVQFAGILLHEIARDVLDEEHDECSHNILEPIATAPSMPKIPPSHGFRMIECHRCKRLRWRHEDLSA